MSTAARWHATLTVHPVQSVYDLQLMGEGGHEYVRHYIGALMAGHSLKDVIDISVWSDAPFSASADAITIGAAFHGVHERGVAFVQAPLARQLAHQVVGVRPALLCARSSCLLPM